MLAFSVCACNYAHLCTQDLRNVQVEAAARVASPCGSSQRVPLRWPLPGVGHGNNSIQRRCGDRVTIFETIQTRKAAVDAIQDSVVEMNLRDSTCLRVLAPRTPQPTLVPTCSGRAAIAMMQAADLWNRNHLATVGRLNIACNWFETGADIPARREEPLPRSNMTALDERDPPEPQALACAVIPIAVRSRGFAPPRGPKPAAQKRDLALPY